MAKHNNLKDLFTATADAIRSKTGGTDPIVADDFPSAIEGIQTGGDAGGGAVIDGDETVRFLDYDGTELYVYTVEEAQALTELPPLPTQPGLVCQGWNWTLDEIKSHNRPVDVGAMYITDDGKTRIYITLQEGRTSPVLTVRIPTGTLTVDWGDGTEPDLLTSNNSYGMELPQRHDYAMAGEYIITLDSAVGINIQGSDAAQPASQLLRKSTNNSTSSTGEGYFHDVYRAAINKIELGKNITVSQYAFAQCSNLTSITIPADATSFSKCAFYRCCKLSHITLPIGTSTGATSIFAMCYNLKSVSLAPSQKVITSSMFSSDGLINRITIPDGVTTIESGGFSGCCNLRKIDIPTNVVSILATAFKGCRCLESVKIPDACVTLGTGVLQECSNLKSVTIQDGVSSIPKEAFRGCSSLNNVILPEAVTSLGENVFYGCGALNTIKIPQGVTTIPYSAFYGCVSLKDVNISNSINVINGSAFHSCESLTEMVIPNGVSSISNMVFYNCASLRKVTVMGDIQSIGNSAFYSCDMVASFKFTGEIATIGASAFQYCRGTRFYDFTGCTIIPALANTNAFSGIPADCEIRVPAALYDEWVAATNWATLADYIVAV